MNAALAVIAAALLCLTLRDGLAARFFWLRLVAAAAGLLVALPGLLS